VPVVIGPCVVGIAPVEPVDIVPVAVEVRVDVVILCVVAPVVEVTGPVVEVICVVASVVEVPELEVALVPVVG
jgi:hypothetical protein